MPNDDEGSPKKVSDLTFTEVLEQLQMLEYIETNTAQGLTDGDRKLRQELEHRQKMLSGDRSLDPKLEDLEKKLFDRQARESHELALKQTADLNRLGPSEQLADLHRQEWEKRIEDYAKERDRYVKEFHESQRMLDKVRERDKQEALKQGDERHEDFSRGR